MEQQGSVVEFVEPVTAVEPPAEQPGSIVEFVMNKPETATEPPAERQLNIGEPLGNEGFESIADDLSVATNGSPADPSSREPEGFRSLDPPPSGGIDRASVWRASGPIIPLRVSWSRARAAAQFHEELIPLPVGYPALTLNETPAPDPWREEERNRKHHRLQVGEQVERAIRNCKVWAETLTPVESFMRACTCFPKVPPLCLPGIIKACFPPKKTTTLCFEGPLQGYPQSNWIEYSMRTFSRTYRVVTEEERQRMLNSETSKNDAPSTSTPAPRTKGIRSTGNTLINIEHA